MLDYLDQRNRNLKPFVWTADADLILGKVARLCKRISLRTLAASDITTFVRPRTSYPSSRTRVAFVTSEHAVIALN
jgi:hypothetical protein